VVDGCQLPTPVLSLMEMAKLFQRLAEGSGESSFKWIRDLMLSVPDWIGGPDRADSLLMKANPNKLIAKEGADGLLAIGVTPSEQFPRGLGIIIKMASGYEPTRALLALKPLLESFSLKCEVSPPVGQDIQYRYAPGKSSGCAIFDLSPILSSKIAVWPGDKTFSLTFSHHVDQGNHLTLSQISTSVHVGSHTDSPIHFGAKEKAMESVNLNSYWGPCQVIEVRKAPPSEIVPEDLKGIDILAPRILFKTSSFPNPNQFNTEFNSLSAPLIAFLAEKKVVLVGIDTPSIDLFDSKDLPTHQATLKYRMAILEGIVLEEVPAGIYHLMALPLRIEGADASPVRAVLVK